MIREGTDGRGAWPTARLGELGFQNGLWKGKKPPYINVGVLRNTNFTSGGSLNMLPEQVAYLDVEERQFSKRSLAFGDIILEKSGGGPKQPVGRVALFDGLAETYSLSNFTSRCRIEDPSILDPSFLHKFLHHCYVSGRTKTMQSHSTGIRNLKLDQYKEIEVPLPPLQEQRRIVARLDDALGEISELRQSLQDKTQLFDDLKASMLDLRFRPNVRAVENRVAKLGELATVSTGKINVNNSVVNGKYPFFTCARRTYRIDEAPYEGKAVLVAGNGDLNVKYFEGRFNAYQRTYFLFSVDEEVLFPRFLYYFLEHYVSALRAGAMGSTIKYIRKGDLSDALIPLPSAAEQRRIVAALDKAIPIADAGQAAAARELNLADSLTTSLMNRLLASA